MILCDTEIAEALVTSSDDERLVVTPLIDSRHQFGPSSLDIRLGTDFAVLETGRFSHIDTARSDTSFKDICVECACRPLKRSTYIPMILRSLPHLSTFVYPEPWQQE